MSEPITRDEVLELLEAVFQVTDKLTRHVDHYDYEGGTNEIEDLYDVLGKWTQRLGYYDEKGEHACGGV